MNWKNLALGAAMVGAVGCGGGTTNPGTDGGPPPEDGGAPQTVTYVIGSINTGSTLPSGQAFGFDLDMMNGGNAAQACTGAADFTSPVTNAMGVDNQLSTVLPTLGSMLGADGADGAIRDQIMAGKLLLVLEVSDINSFNNDDSVQVHVRLGQVPAMGTPMTSAACTAHTDMTSCAGDAANACNWNSTMSACQGLASGQTFMTMTDLGTQMGTIASGRLSVTTAMLPLMFTASGTTISLVLRDVHIGGRITATGMTGGEFGASVLVDDVVTLAMMFITGVDRATVESLAMPDLQPDATGAHCNAISAGLGFSAVTATIN
jgi:hypothetical protein